MITLMNGRVITPETIFDGGIQMEGKRIVRVFHGADFEPRGEVIDCGGQYVSPGFVDIHVHGAYQASFLDGDPDALRRATVFHAQHGTTSILPTTPSASHEQIYAALLTIRDAMRAAPCGAKVLGGHLEGCYLNPAWAGAQNPAYLFAAEPEEYMPLIELGVIRRISASPEVPGVLDMARRLAPTGICMSVAHSGADYDCMMRALDAGFRHVTHIYNATSMLSNVYFYPAVGVAESALLHEGYTVEAICDGRHVPPQLLRLMYKIKGARGFHAVTDADLAGAPDGYYDHHGMALLVEDQVAMLANRTAFAGSIATTDRLVRTLYKDAQIPLADAVAMVSLTPARQIGEEHRIGRLAEGYAADVNVFDESIAISRTYIDGALLPRASIATKI